MKMKFKRPPLHELLNRWPLMGVMLAVSAAYAIYVIISFSGTGDSGDSITHFQFARYAFKHPMNLMDSWAKPVFVLLAAPAAQFGFTGMKVFNVVLALLSALMLQRILSHFRLLLAWMAIPFLFTMPLYFIMMFSGLTEYLFAFMLILALWMVLKEHYWAAAVVISFLPFVRSEGYLILPCFALIFLMRKKFWPLSALFAGHLVYAVAGAAVFGEPLWMFTRNAYVAYSDEYGSGDCFHFFHQLPYVTGFPMSIFFGMALLLLILVSLIPRLRRGQNELDALWILAVAPFMLYFFAHVIFWKFGLFHSMGLKRVLLAVVPLMIIPVVWMLNMFYTWISTRFKRLASLVVMLLFHAVVVFPFTDGPAAVHPERDLMPDESQMRAAQAAPLIAARAEYKAAGLLYCSHPYLKYLLDIDPFDRGTTRRLVDFALEGPAHDRFLVIYDTEYGPVEDGLALESLLARDDIELLEVLPDTSAGLRFYLFK